MRINRISVFNNQRNLNRALNLQVSKANEKLIRAENVIKINISEKCRKMLQQQGKDESVVKKIQEGNAMLESFQEQLEASKETAEGYADVFKLLEIARRIANGDKVPYKDEKKLMEYNRKLYLAAKQAAIFNENKKPKEYDSMFEEEEDADCDVAGKACAVIQDTPARGTAEAAVPQDAASQVEE